MKYNNVFALGKDLGNMPLLCLLGMVTASPV